MSQLEYPETLQKNIFIIRGMEGCIVYIHVCIVFFNLLNSQIPNRYTILVEKPHSQIYSSRSLRS